MKTSPCSNVPTSSGKPGVKYSKENRQVHALINRTSLVIRTASDLADSLTNTCLIDKLCLNVGVCPWLSVNLKKYKEMVPSGLLNIRHLYFYF
jgi:hypothetical protein